MKKYKLDSEKIKKEFKSIRHFERVKELPVKTLYCYIHGTNFLTEDYLYFMIIKDYLILIDEEK